MRQVTYMLMTLLLASSLLTCTRLSPITPNTLPIAGIWVLTTFEMSGLPTWFINKTRTSPDQTLRELNNNEALAVAENINSYTFTSGGNVSEQYIVDGAIPRISRVQVDTGKWAITDSLVTLQAANQYPHQLVYMPKTNLLVTNTFEQTAIIEYGSITDRDTVSYKIRLFYGKLP